MSSKLKNVVVLDEKMLNQIAEGEVKFDNRKNNPGRPVNKKSARYIRLKKQALYAKLNKQFVSGKKFKINNGTAGVYMFESDINGGSTDTLNTAHIVDAYTKSYVCTVTYIGRTKVLGSVYVLGKRVNVEINLKQVKFVS